MCLIALAWNTRPGLPLALIANRDELHARPSTPAGPDPEAPEVHGGRDLVQGGGWLQVSSRRRLAAVTNVRTGAGAEAAAYSRGWLVRDFVRGSLSTEAFATALADDAAAYGPFNLLLWDGAALWFAGNHPASAAHPLAPGLHAMSNGAFDAPWPKSAAATASLQAWLESPSAAHAMAAEDPASTRHLAPLFAGLRDTRPAPDPQLPDTGVGLALERRLSPPFLDDPVYGTRCSSVVLAGPRAITLVERRYGPAGRMDGTTAVRLATA